MSNVFSFSRAFLLAFIIPIVFGPFAWYQMPFVLVGCLLLCGAVDWCIPRFVGFIRAHRR